MDSTPESPELAVALASQLYLDIDEYRTAEDRMDHAVQLDPGALRLDIRELLLGNVAPARVTTSWCDFWRARP